jgi:trimethylamine:corrinoid methyltransferase-like protein
MKEIKYKNKTIKLPFADADYGPDPLEEVTIKNRFSGQSTTMPAFAAAVYDVIIGAEMLKQYDDVRKGLDWFKQHFAEQYMVVLD